jgi:hypothetical protein
MSSLFVLPISSWVLMLIILAGPFAIILILVASLRRSEASAAWILGILIVCGLVDVWFVWWVGPPQLPPKASVFYPFYMLWWVVAAGALVGFPLGVFREGRKRGWLSRGEEQPRRKRKRRHRPSIQHEDNW